LKIIRYLHVYVIHINLQYFNNPDGATLAKRTQLDAAILCSKYTSVAARVLKGQCHEMVVELRPWSGRLGLN
jgi:hypothetical protein